MGKVVFFGSPDFAIPSFEAILDTPYRPSLVVTQPARRSGRGRKFTPTPVHRAAEEKGIPVVVAGTFKKREVLERLKAVDADFFVVVAFGLIFPASVLNISRKGNINVHASLLPRYRGASPVNHAILNGDQFTGVTTMEMSKLLDAGPIYRQSIVSIDPMETAGSLFERLAVLGGDLLLDTLKGIESGGLEPAEQPEVGASKAPLLKKSDGEIPWDRNSIEIHNHIRGMNPWPGSYTYHEGNYIKIHKAEPIDLLRRTVPHGTIIHATGDGIYVSCGSGLIKINNLQMEGKRPMDSNDFIRGYRVNKGEVFGGQ